MFRSTDKIPNKYDPLVLIWNNIREADRIDSGTMNNSLADLLILKTFKIQNRVSRASRIIEIEWKKPNTWWIKVNMDEAVNGSPGIVGCGGIFPTYRGFCKGCFDKPLAVLYAFEAELYAFEAELWGVIIVVEYAIKFHWTHLWFEYDATYVVDLLQNKSINIPWKFLTRWVRAMNYLQENTYYVTHVFREGNHMADKLASHATHLEEENWWFACRNFISLAVNKDNVGLLLYRFSR
ncbi:hypothetical protein TIFTF001_037072 [Ficus carica]|uniref:RNase H type-1 domain-containing protein n=1 Tax=Ficus carica TaxID=3494 RepID=A0AA88E5H5_FICCA|nr:hypothetical protein TIFTF001_037072 [Ficus carica]